MRSHSRSSRLLAVPAAMVLLLTMTPRFPAQRLGEGSGTSALVLHNENGIVETGSLDHAAYRIDIPNNWNHGLVVFYHGYSQGTWGYHPTHVLTKQNRPMLERGYAVIQSGYSDVGWAMDKAMNETENLRKYFIRRYGRPKETIVAGASMGGVLTDITLERNPKPYIGGLDLCGSVGPTFESFTRRFVLRAAFDAYFPNALPPLVPPPSSGYPEPAIVTQATRRRLAELLHDHPAQATALRNLMGLHSDIDVANVIAYYSFVVADMQHKAGGNPFDNRNYLYTGTNPNSSVDDGRLNDMVRRYAADPQARRYLATHVTPTGRLTRPMLALHTTYDPLIPGPTLALYDHMVQEAGFGENLVQQYVHRDGHCTMSAEEIGIAFDELTTWVHSGRRPVPGLLR